MKIGTRILGVLEIPSKMGGSGGTMPIMMPMSYTPWEEGGSNATPTPKKQVGRFSADGRYHLAPNEVFTIPDNDGLIQISADANGKITEVNICAMRDRVIKITLNGEIK